MKLETILTVAKSISIKREKGDGDCDVTRAHVKFTDLYITREQVNELVRQRPGWCETAFFDELNAPLGAWSLVPHDTALEVSGRIRASEIATLSLPSADLTAIEITFVGTAGTPGALVSGQLAWLVAGDESSDIEPLLGRICGCNLVVIGTGQERMDFGVAA